MENEELEAIVEKVSDNSIRIKCPCGLIHYITVKGNELQSETYESRRKPNGKKETKPTGTGNGEKTGTGNGETTGTVNGESTGTGNGEQSGRKNTGRKGFFSEIDL